MRRERACKGCDGTGELEATRATPIPDEPTRGHFWRCGTCGSQNTEMDGTCQFCECGGTACTRWGCDDPRHFPPCLACLGTGRVVDHIPAADAVADAETLRLNAPEGSIRAVTLNEAATRPLEFPRSAATLAFCVVPELRG